MPVAPKCPYVLGGPGQKWWDWAWRTPQAAHWDAGAVFTAARRALLEDQMAALDFEEQLDTADLLAGADQEAMQRVEWALSQLRQAATGSVSLSREMGALETQLGLGPKALAALGWKPVDPKVDRADELKSRRAKRVGGAAA